MTLDVGGAPPGARHSTCLGACEISYDKESPQPQHSPLYLIESLPFFILDPPTILKNLQTLGSTYHLALHMRHLTYPLTNLYMSILLPHHGPPSL